MADVDRAGPRVARRIRHHHAARQGRAQDVDHGAEPIALVAAAFGRAAERCHVAALADFVWVGAGQAVPGHQPAGRRLQTLVRLVADLAGGDGRGRHVEQERLARLARRGEGDRIGSEAGLRAIGRRHVDAARRGRRHADEAGVDRLQHIEAAGAEVAGVAHGRHPDAGLLCLVDGDLHGAPAGGMAEAAAAVDQHRHRRLLDDPGLGADMELVGPPALIVGRHHRDAVRVDAVQVGPTHDLRRAGRGLLRHAPGFEDQFELLAVGLVGRGHASFSILAAPLLRAGNAAHQHFLPGRPIHGKTEARAHHPACQHSVDMVMVGT